MLTPYDDYLVHQAPTTFAHAVTSDHRFFDRWAVGAHNEDLAVMYGLANYKNTNVCDGYLCFSHRDRQYNLRLSRPLRPDFAMAVAPLEIAILEPLVRHRIRVDEDPRSAVTCDLTWTGTRPIREEDPHFQRVDGRVSMDFRRLYQVGRLNGWVAIGGERCQIDDAWAWRDHSWGVRPSMGGVDPVGGPVSEAKTTNLFLWFAFEVGDVTGQFQLKHDVARNSVTVKGHVLPDAAQPDSAVDVAIVQHRINFVDGVRAFDRAALRAIAADGRAWDFEVVVPRPAWAFAGSGYSGGWDDRQGLGVPRGDRLEFDQYELLGHADVRMPDGSVTQPWHREAEVLVSMDGAEGFGHLTVIANEPVPPSCLGEEA